MSWPLWVCTILLLHYTGAIRWLALRSSSLQWNQSTVSCRLARLHHGLARRQTRLCRSTVDAMPHVVRAASQAVVTCKMLFKDRRWNCSSIEQAPHLSPDLTTGTREQAYVYALSSAAVAYSVARACAMGALFHCACSSPPRDPPNGNFKWGGCGDNVRWGTHFARQFTDSAERGNGKKQKKNRQRSQVAAVNLHNNRAGRRAVEAALVTQCKCHGVSGSCNIKTCWRALPRLVDVGERLKRRFSEATEVVSRRVGTGRKLLPASAAMGLYNEDDLIYVTKSPDYCLRDPRLGSLGTHGRTCNATSEGYDSCTQMCCGRGYSSLTIDVQERCHCKYYWCCYVKCKTCHRRLQVHQCN
ncbi:protein Wnt-11b-2 [Anabrus simplex]|uniref:protein Wnt-11b-2 n=1 Tax=Anabrus simplex TaxID=316456 RepID=UPI0034DD9F84